MQHILLVAGLAVFGLGQAAAQDIVFGPPEGYPIKTSGSLLLVSAVGDIDEDGAPDAIVGGLFPSTSLQTLINNGDGTFGPATTFATGDTSHLQLADMDEDGHLDLVTTNGTIRLKLGNGDGTFGPNQFVFSVSDPRFFEIFDVNGDGHLDVIALSGAEVLGNGFVYVIPGNGDGSTGLPYVVDVVSGYAAHAADMGDVDHDGIDDLIVATSSLTDGAALLYLGTGSGLFAEPLSFGMGQGAADVRLSDVDGDGHLDMLLAGSSGIGVKLGQGDGSFDSATVVTSEAVNARLALGDFDADDDLDLAAVHGDLAEMIAYRNAGDGQFSEAARVTGMVISDDLRPADYDQDGKTDLARALTSLDEEWQVLTNHGYGEDEPWTDLGLALSETETGLAQRPIFWAEGALTASSPLSFFLARNEVALPSAWLILGVSGLFAPFKGGTLVPSPDVFVGPLFPATSETLELATVMPTGVPAGSQIWIQGWFTPGTSTLTQFAATTGVTAVTP